MDVRILYTLMFFGYVACFFEDSSYSQCPIAIHNDLVAFQLPFQDQFVNQDVIHDEDSNCLCKIKPNDFTICFGPISSNKCQIPRKFNVSTKVFFLKNTAISELKTNDFQQWGDIIDDLSLENNEELKQISGGSFSGLIKLKTLRITNSKNLKSLQNDSFSGLVQLRTLILEQNGFNSILEVTITLKYLPHLRALGMNGNIFSDVPENAFDLESNSKIETLSLEQCQISYIHPRAFNGLSKLTTLSLGKNFFNISTLTSLLNNLLVTDNLKSLRLFSLSYQPQEVVEILKTVANRSVEQLDLSNNKMDLSHALLSTNITFSNIKVLNLSYILATYIRADAFTNFPNLQVIILSHNYFNLDPHLELNSLVCLDISDVSKTQAKLNLKTGFKNMANLQYLDMSKNSLESIWNWTFQGLSSLRSLNLQNANVFYIDNNTFQVLEKLRYLDLSYNKINDSFIKNADLFNGLQNLEVLLLGSCNISFVTAYSLRHLKALKILDLRNNQLKAVASEAFQNLAHLQQINFEANCLGPWDKSLLNNTKVSIVNLRYNKLTFISKAMLADFNNLTDLNLEWNQISCEWNYCQQYHGNISKNLLQNLKKLNCTNPKSKTTYKLLDYIKLARKACREKEKNFVLILSVSLTVSAILALIFAGLVYRYRWHLRYALFLTRLYLARHGHLQFRSNTKGTAPHSFEYDAFVSYSTEDRSFVQRLVSMLENHEPYLRLCVCERDFQIGSIISESVLESVAKSRRTLLIISDSYAKSQWCRWETQIAENHNLFFGKDYGKYVDDSLIIVKLSSLNRKHLTPTLRYLLKTRIYLEWDAEEEKQKVFWKKLRNALAPPASSALVDLKENGISIIRTKDDGCQNQLPDYDKYI